MRTPDDLAKWAQGQWRRNWRSWLVAPESRTWPLHPPTEAQLAADPDAASAWVSAWRRVGVPGLEVQWVERRWPAFGRQSLPARVILTPEAVARLAGRAGEWTRATTAAIRLRGQWPEYDLDQALQAAAPGLAGLDDAGTVRLLSVLNWLATHPDSGLWERELPVPGVDTKWWERNRSLVGPLAAAITGEDGAGLRRAGIVFLVRVLDPALTAGPSEFGVDLPGLKQLDLAPATVLVCENRTTVTTLPPLTGAVAVHGMGFAAPTLSEVPWLPERLVYWGDLDTHGFHILGQVRRAIPRVRSVLMDADTLRAHAHLTVGEPRPFRGEIGFLTAAELDALAQVRQGDLRLEQERIGRDWVRRALSEAAAERGD